MNKTYVYTELAIEGKQWTNGFVVTNSMIEASNLIHCLQESFKNSCHELGIKTDIDETTNAKLLEMNEPDLIIPNLLNDVPHQFGGFIYLGKFCIEYAIYLSDDINDLSKNK